jgi:CheY-like chemotaxis protein
MKDLASWNVLVIDDEPDNSGVVEHVLTFFDIRCRSANSGVSGLQMIHQDRPNILLLDIQMPRMSGWDVLRVIRDSNTLNNLFVVAMTAHAMDGDREKAIRAGFDGYIPKPISPISLINDIKELVERWAYKHNYQDWPKPPVPPPSPAYFSPFNTSVAQPAPIMPPSIATMPTTPSIPPAAPDGGAKTGVNPNGGLRPNN